MWDTIQHPAKEPPGIDRRRFLAFTSALGLGGTAFPEALWGLLDGTARVTGEILEQAAKVAGLELTEAERHLMLEGMNDLLAAYEKIRQVPLENSIPPAFRFHPLPVGWEVVAPRRHSRRSRPPVIHRPDDLEELAFLPVIQLARLVETRRVTALELARMYLRRLERYDPLLRCAVTVTEELALEQAARADREIAAGRYRGPLHGIPWGAKDLLAARGYPTTWGAVPYRDQLIDEDATVVRRLAEAGAVLVAKLSLGALAWGDVWFGGKTRNPWDPDLGSSGSSAGSAAATAAGLVGFSIGSETLGSIVSPATRCGVTGLRPTFGRISRHGAMILSWTMDKLGPICRSAEDCALVLEAIHGADGRDGSAVDVPFVWDAGVDPRSLRVGYAAALFEGGEGREREGRDNDLATLEVLRRSLGLELLPLELPDLPVAALSFILAAEAAAAFDELTRSGRDDLMVRQVRQAWPNSFREARLIPAVEYLQANRVRTLLVEEMARLFAEIDVYVAPSFGGSNLLLTNLTGHPAVVVPNGFRSDAIPTSISFIGAPFGEAKALALARAYQEVTAFHLRHPGLSRPEAAAG